MHQRQTKIDPAISVIVGQPHFDNIEHIYIIFVCEYEHLLRYEIPKLTLKSLRDAVASSIMLLLHEQPLAAVFYNELRS